jgi:hypothetical protein
MDKLQGHGHALRMEKTMATIPDCLRDSTDAEIVGELARRLALLAGTGSAGIDAAENLVESLLKSAGVPQHFLDYWLLGDLIEEQSPYFHKGEGHLILTASGEIDPATIRVAGILQTNDSRPGHTYQDTNPRQDIPKPPVLGGPTAPPTSFYFRPGRDSRELRPGGPLGDETRQDDERFERNIIKVVEIEYAPPIIEDDVPKPPHIIILYGGGDH